MCCARVVARAANENILKVPGNPSSTIVSMELLSPKQQLVSSQSLGRSERDFSILFAADLFSACKYFVAINVSVCFDRLLQLFLCHAIENKSRFDKRRGFTKVLPTRQHLHVNDFIMRLTEDFE